LIKKKLKIFETFAGYGGASFGFKKANIPHLVIGYSEIDKYASAIFELNHPGIKNFGDITKINSKTIPDFDVFTGGFPCQPFSSA
jgi:DNA (cytosine-5)-methyltransferase 1